ncbi:MAG: CCA tRNA nucleotidyltransferase [Candidatus Micrarchaeales archaeon]
MGSERKRQISALQKKKIDAVLATVLPEVKPTEKEIERVTAYANEIMSRLKKIVPRDVEIISAGSVARGTQVRGTSDIDIFLLFPRSMSEETMEKKGVEIAKKIVAKHKNESFVIKYSEHPYLKLILGDLGVNADIVPAFKITNSSQRISAVDRTQLHNVFMLENLTKSQKDDVRLLKAFLKSHGIYGSDSKTEGFSGYLCELLVYHFGSFVSLLAGISGIHLPVIIDPLHRATLTDKKDVVKTLIKKFNKEFVVLDPTDENRNVAAVVSNESLARFVVVSRLFLGNPTLGLFYGPRYSDIYSKRKLTRLREELGLEIYTLYFKVPDIADDIIWQQIKRLGGSLNSILHRNGFNVIMMFENVGSKEAILSLFVGNSKMGYSVAEGPSAFMEESAGKFMAAHSKALGMLFKDDRIVFIEEPKYGNVKDLINASLTQNILPSYIKKEHTKLYVNDMPEPVAKLLYSAFIKKTSI